MIKQHCLLKKVTLFIILTVVCIMLIGCDSVKKDEAYSDVLLNDCFTLVASGTGLNLYKENKTEVMYIVYGHSGIAIMTTADGVPLTYSKWKDLQ